MIKRDFLKTGSAIVAGTLLSGLGTGITLAQQRGYEIIDPPMNTDDPSKVEVMKFFWFGCPHCFSFEPTINRWDDNKPEYITLVREAPPLNPSWEPHSRAFYAAEALGVKEVMFDEMFNGIHVDRRNLRSPDSIVKFMGELGIDEDKFSKTMDSFSVNAKMRRAVQLAKAAGINGVPTLVVNGKYRTGASLAGGHEGMIRVVTELAAREKELLASVAG